jgi:LytS/YehU family sensor histidine kinase
VAEQISSQVMFQAQSDEGLLFLLLIVAAGFAIRYYFLLSNEKEHSGQLGIFLNSANEEISRLKHDVKQLEESEKRLLEEEKKLKAEIHLKKLDNLRFALNPHSFKNTLNSIQGMARDTYESVRGLSGTIDYMLYDAQEVFVSLDRELEFANQYLVLFQKKLRPSFNIQIDLDLSHRPDFMSQFIIAPLITAGFIENAFQHGDTESPEAFISVKIEIINNRSVLYTVRNRIRAVPHRGKGGLGQSKMKERLDLLYPSKYHLEYKNEQGVFTSLLKLELHERKDLVHTGG